MGEGRRIAGFTLRRWHIALALGLLLVAAGALPVDRVPEWLDLDVLGLVYFMSIVTGYLEVSGVAEAVAARVARLGGRKAVFWMLMASGGLSLILENVSVVFLFAPVALKLAERLDIDPRPVVIGVALSSDMAGSATMIGDPPAIITAGYFDLNFLDFIVYRGRPSMFFYTVAAMVAACAVITTAFVRTASASGGTSLDVNVDKIFMAEVLAFLFVKIVLLSIRDAIHIPLTLAALVAIAGITGVRLLLHRDIRSVKEAVSKHDIETPLFLAGAFLISGAFVETGLAHQIASLILRISQGELLRVELLLIAVSMIASAVIYNTPYVVAMLPIVGDIAARLHVDPVPIAWALLIGATLGGTLTYIGAMGNYAAVRFLAQRGYAVDFRRFALISVPFTLTSVAVGTTLFYLSWHWNP